MCRIQIHHDAGIRSGFQRTRNSHDRLSDLATARNFPNLKVSPVVINYPPLRWIEGAVTSRPDDGPRLGISGGGPIENQDFPVSTNRGSIVVIGDGDEQEVVNWI